jgi:DNA-nicking Smr family endonuclease
LDEWDKIKREHKESSRPPVAESASASASAARHSLESWLAANGVDDKDAETGDSPEPGLESRRFAKLKPQAALDLHGLTGEEAESAIAAFIDESSRQGLEKVLVIHGKGLHSAGLPVLKKAARRALEAHRLAGRFGEADKADGGSGALWVLIRRRG